MTHTPGPERSALYELLRYGRKHDGPWTEAIAGDQLIDEENADLYTAAPDMLAALKYNMMVLDDPNPGTEKRLYALALTKAAIAKAEGRTA
jgi:hypothetical protein